MKLTRLLLRPITNAVQKQLDRYSEFCPSSLSIQQYLDFGRTGNQKASYLFLRKELLVRLANIMQEINLLPSELLQMPSARLVRDWYHSSFSDLLKFEQKPPNSEIYHDFNDTINAVLSRHRNVVETMAEGLMELKQAHGVDVSTERGLQYFLDRFYINRISIRMLMNQHLLLFSNEVPDSPRYIGAIDTSCNVIEVINVSLAKTAYYLTSPGLKLECTNAVHENMPITVVYVPSHLYHIMFELFKNAMRAVVEYHAPDQELPDLKIFLVKGKDDLSIKICDRGGGVPRHIVDMMFNYMYTTAPPPQRDGVQAPLAGYGYGLPLSRLYARYFQGDLFLVSMEGYGTDACIYLRALPIDAAELLPIFSTASKRQLTQATQAADWSQPMPFTHHFYNQHHFNQPSRAFSTLFPNIPPRCFWSTRHPNQQQSQRP